MDLPDEVQSQKGAALAELASNYVTEDNVTRMAEDRNMHNITEILNSKEKANNSRAM